MNNYFQIFKPSAVQFYLISIHREHRESTLEHPVETLSIENLLRDTKRIEVYRIELYKVKVYSEK